MVLPLPLNAVEQYMLADDSARYPRCFVFVLHWNEPIVHDRLEAAIEATTRRHPLLRALVEYDGDRPRRWVECPQPAYRIEWCDEQTSTRNEHSPHVMPIDLRTAPGLRFRAKRDGAGDTLAIQFHHACTDGIGALQFVGDIVTLYDSELNRSTAQLPPLQPERLPTRDALGLTGWRRVVRWLYGTLGWLAAIEFLLHRPAPLGATEAFASPSAGPKNGFCSRRLTTQETSALVRAAKRAGVTVNDLLIRDAFVAIQAVTEQHWPERVKAHKRIMVPANLRTRDDGRLPAANVVAMINIDRRPHHWTDPQSLLRVLHWELSIVKRLRLGVVFVQILHTLQFLFGSLRRFLPDDRCQATCVVSNLGPLSPELDSDLLRAIEFYPPIRPLTAAAFGVLTHGGKLTISLNYDASAISAEQAGDMIDMLAGMLRIYETADPESTTAPFDRDGAVGGSTEPAPTDLLRSHS